MQPFPDKAILRKHYRKLRQAVSTAQRDAAAQAIVERVLEHPAMQSAAVVFAYLAMGSELETRPMLHRWLQIGRALAVPRLIDVQHMEAVLVGGLEDCVKDPHRPGLLMPIRGRVLDTTPQVTLVPGLAFTRKGHRLGQGGGCYDRYLCEHGSTISIGLAFDVQLADELPIQQHDQPVRWIITPTQTIDCSLER